MPMNLCRSCGQDFSGVSIFDKHRVGKHEYLWSPDREDGRRCLDVQEMETLGFALDKHGRWSDLVQATRLARHFESKSATVCRP